MHKTISALMCASVLSLVAQAPWRGAAAAENAPSEAAAVQPSEKAVEYARRYLVAIRMEDTIRLFMDALGPALVEGEAAKQPGLTAADKQLILEAVTESMVAIMPRFTDLYAVELATIFTEDELRQLAEFYESPVGRAYASKAQAISQAGERAMMALVPEISRNMEQRLCRRIDCDRRADSVAS